MKREAKMPDNKAEITISTKISQQIQAFGQEPAEVQTQFLQLISTSEPLKEIAKTNPASLLLGVAKLRQMNMSIDNLDGESCLIPYKDKDTGKRYAQIQIQ